MTKRLHTEVVKGIQLKLIGDDAQQSNQTSRTVGIYTGTEFGEKRRIKMNNDGTLPIDSAELRTIAIHGMQNWSDGIGEETVQCLTKLASSVGTLTPKQRAVNKHSRRKYCLNFFLPFAFKGDQESTFGKNLSTLLRIPGLLLHSVGAFGFSESGNLATFFQRFPQLLADPNFPKRYDVHVYCENDTLVEDYFADVKHWLVDLNKNSPMEAQQAMASQVRQCRLKFVIDREDTATEMLKLFKENFDNAANGEGEEDGRRTFVVRFDCPGFALDEFYVNNDKTGEVLVLSFKHAQVLKVEDGDEGMKADDDEAEEATEEKKSRHEEEVVTKGKTSNANNGKAEDDDNDDDKEEEEEEAESVVEWKTYHLIRCPSAAQLEQLRAVEVPFLSRSFSIIY